MTNGAPTALNQDEVPLFDGPIPADIPRRQFDRRLLENLENDHKRVREISGRLTRLESLFEQIKSDIGRLENGQREGLGFQEQTASSMVQMSNRLAVHTEMEDYRWATVSTSNKHLEELSATLAAHLQSSSAINERINWIERGLFGVYGAFGSVLLLVGGWALSRIA